MATIDPTSGLEIVVCSCPECVEMCKRRPCWPNPEEARKIIGAGFGDRLMIDWWVGDGYNGGDIELLCGAMKGREGKRAPEGFLFVGPHGRCTFLDANDKCELHDLGLKPGEGKVADCNRGAGNAHRSYAMSWNTETDQKLVKDWQKGLFNGPQLESNKEQDA